MAATHGGGNLFPSGSPAAGGTSVSASGSATSAVVDNHVGYGATVTVQIINGGSGPSAPATVAVQISADNGTYIQWAYDTAGITAGTTYAFAYPLPPEVAYARVVVTGNTGQAITAQAQSNILTGV